MSDIFKELRHLRASEMRTKLNELGVDYNTEGAKSKEDLRRLLFKALTSKGADDSKRKRRPREVSGSEDSELKKVRAPIKSSDRFNSANRKVKVPKEKEEEEGGKKKPPGMLGRMPVKQVIRTSVSNEREQANKSMESEKSEESLSSVHEDQAEDDDKAPTTGAGAQNRSVSRKQWNRRTTTNINEVEEARKKANAIKKTVLEKEAEIASKKLDVLNRQIDENQEKEMEERRKARFKARNPREASASNEREVPAAANALFRKTMNHIEQVKEVEKEPKSPEVVSEVYECKPPYQIPHRNNTKNLGPNEHIREKEDSDKFEKSEKSWSPPASKDRTVTSRPFTQRTMDAEREAAARRTMREDTDNIGSKRGFLFSSKNTRVPEQQPQIPVTYPEADPYVRGSKTISSYPLPEEPRRSARTSRSAVSRYMPKPKMSKWKYIRENLTMPWIVILIMVCLLALTKLSHVIYHKVLDIDNAVFCPTDYSRNNSTLSPKMAEILKVCIDCPENGHCDLNGYLRCKPKYIRRGRKCVKDSDYSERAEYYGQAIHADYLYYKGNVECGMLPNILSKGQFVSDKISGLEPEIKVFLSERHNVAIETFNDEVVDVFEKYMEVSDEPRYTLTCLIKKTIQDNLILIIIVGALMVTLIAVVSHCIMNCINYYRAKEVYKQLEIELKAGSLSGSLGIEDGIAEEDIVTRFRNNMSEAYFKRKMLPHLEKLRKDGRKIKKFDGFKHGKTIVKWQYLN